MGLMGQQPAANARPSRATPPPPGRSKSVLFGAIAVVLVGVGLVAFWRGRDTADATAAPAPEVAAKAEPQKLPSFTDVHPTPQAEAAAAAVAAIGPHKQADLPPVPFRGYAPPRPKEVVTAAFQFAAEHPEISSYVPCFCGCQQGGHRGNEDCFVHARKPNGDVAEWEEHGVECAVCIDVATRSRQMYAAGASARDIRAAIEKEFAPGSQTMTPTPRPPTN